MALNAHAPENRIIQQIVDDYYARDPRAINGIIQPSYGPMPKYVIDTLEEMGFIVDYEAFSSGIYQYHVVTPEDAEIYRQSHLK